MKIKALRICILGLFILNSCNQPKINNKAFILNGKIDGSSTKYVVLNYIDSSNVYVSDTLQVKNQSFYKEGYLIHPQQVSLTSNLTGLYMEDPNRLHFFLEPNKIDVNIKEGQFTNAEIIGSKTQNENENLTNMIKPFYDKIDVIQLKKEKLISNNKEIINKNLKIELEDLNKERRKLFDDIKSIEIQYAIENPESYLSAYLLNFNIGRLPIDSLSMLYSHLDPMIKESFYGIEIQKEIKLKYLDSGDIAPNFNLEDIKGDSLNLNQFKGQTVLLDFGAAWCVPCIKEIPEVKRIYDKYHPKGLEIIGVSWDNDKASWKESVKKKKLNWHHIYEGRSGSIGESYYIKAIPAYVLIDEKGMIIDRFRGADKEDKSLTELEEKLNSILISN